MRTRLCYAALVLLPVIAYWHVVGHEFGTPEDFIRLGGDGRVVESHHQGIVHGALVEISFAAVDVVGGFAMVRGIALLLTIFCGIALWQIFERGGWGEIDAAAMAVGICLLPSAQLHIGWGTAWPAALAALLSLAGFAAAESELEQGGAKRTVAMFGGVLLYLAGAMCYLPGATMAIVPIAAVGFIRPIRLAGNTPRWLLVHTGLLFLGILAAWLLERTMMNEAGLSDHATLAGRMIALFTVALPAAWALFFAATSEAMRVICLVIALAVLTVLVLAARSQSATDQRAAMRWWCSIGGALGFYCIIAMLFPNWRAGYQSLWSASGVVLVGVFCAIRGAGELPVRKSKFYGRYGAYAGFVFLGLLVAGTQANGVIVEPLGREWSSLRTAVLRANFSEKTQAWLVLRPGATQSGPVPEPSFGDRIASHGLAAEAMFHAAVKVRYPSGLPRHSTLTLELTETPPAAAPTDLVFDLGRLAR